MGRALPRPCAEPACHRTIRKGTRCKQCQADHNASRPGASKRGYTSKAWRAIRKRQLDAEPLCRQCQQDGKRAEATEVDHILPRSRGGSDDESNLQSLCKSCHSRKTAEDSIAVEDKPRTVEVELVCGPPGSGREEYVLDHLTDGDLVIDDEEIMAAISGLPKFEQVASLLPAVQAARSSLIESVVIRPSLAPKVWIISQAKTPGQVGAALGRLELSKTTKITASAKACRARLIADEFSAPHVDRLMSDGSPWFTRKKSSRAAKSSTAKRGQRRGSK